MKLMKLLFFKVDVAQVYCLFFFSLTKDYNNRPKYPDLLAHRFLDDARNDHKFSMGAFVQEILGVAERERESVLQNFNIKTPVSESIGPSANLNR